MNYGTRIKGIALLLFALLAAAITVQARGIPPDVLSRAQLQRKDGLFYLYVEGTPYEMGFQHGSLMKEQIKLIYDIYLHKKAIKDWVKNYALLKSEARGVKDPKVLVLPDGCVTVPETLT